MADAQDIATRPATDSYYKKQRNLSVAQLLLEYLKLEGISKLFGIPGATLAYLLREIRNQQRDFEFIVCRHESGAVYIAHGYSIVTDLPGVVLTGAGPGATNALTGALNAEANGAPVLVITGEVDQQFFGRGYLQEGVETGPDIDEIYQSAVAYSAVISDQANFPTMVQAAFRQMLSLPRRAAHLSLPTNVAAECVDRGEADNKAGTLVSFPVPTTPAAYRTEPSGTDRQQVKTAVESLVAQRRPLIFLGNGCRRALRDERLRNRFEKFVQKFAIPVMTTPHAKGIFPESHELSLRNYGMTACRWPQRYMKTPDDPEHFDGLLVLGSSLGHLSTMAAAAGAYASSLIPNGPFIQLDLDQSVIGRNFPFKLGIVAEVGATIEALCELGDELGLPAPHKEEREELIKSIRKESAFEDADLRDPKTTGAGINPAALMKAIGEVLKENSEKAGGGHIYIDAGNCAGWSLHHMVIDPPLEYHIPIDMAPMGFAVGAVIGGKIAVPDKPCVAVVGDGAFLMHGAEVSTAAQNKVGAVWVVLYDNDLRMTSQGIAADFGKGMGRYELGKPNLVKFAQGLGADAVAVTRKQGPQQFREKLQGALERAERHKPQVIVVRIDDRPAPPYHWPKRKVPDCRAQRPRRSRVREYGR